MFEPKRREKLLEAKRAKNKRRETKGDILEPWPRTKTGRIGMQLQMMPALTSATLLSFRDGGLMLDDCSLLADINRHGEPCPVVVMKEPNAI